MWQRQVAMQRCVCLEVTEVTEVIDVVSSSHKGVGLGASRSEAWAQARQAADALSWITYGAARAD